MADNSLVPANEIWYTTTDGKTIKLQGSIRAKVASNIYKKREGKGVIVFNEPIIEIDNKTFCGFACLQKMILPEGVTSIGEEAFCYCDALQKVVIPSSVTSIGNRAFEDCTSLECVTFLSRTKIREEVHPWLGKKVFLTNPSLKAINAPSDCVDYYKEVLPVEFHDKIVEL